MKEIRRHLLILSLKIQIIYNKILMYPCLIIGKCLVLFKKLMNSLLGVSHE